MSCAFFCYTLVGIQDDMYVSASQISLLVLLSRRLYDDFCRSSLLLLRVKSMCSSSALALSYYICISYHLVQEFIVFHLSCFFLLLRFHFDSIVRKCFYVEFIHVACTRVVLLVPWEIILLGSVGWLPPNDNPFLVHVFYSASFSSWNFHSWIGLQMRRHPIRFKVTINVFLHKLYLFF